MKTKNFVILIFTTLFVLMSGLFLFFQISEIDRNKESDVKDILKSVEKEIQNGYIKNETIGSFKKDLFYVIWIKNVNNGEWYPLLYDKLSFKGLKLEDNSDPNSIDKKIESKAKILKHSVNGVDFIVWTKLYSPTNILKNIVLPILILILIYLVILLIINIFFGIEDDENDYIEQSEEKKLIKEEPKKEIKRETPLVMPEISLSEEDIKSDEDYENKKEHNKKIKDREKVENKKEEKQSNNRVSDNIEKDDDDEEDSDDEDDTAKIESIERKDIDDIDFNERLSYELTNDEFKKLLSPIEREPEHINRNNEKILNDYRELWQKHFKTSENFKSNFPFLKLYNVIKFGITPENYIEEGLKIASSYFGWDDPQIYIKQKNFFVSTKTKEIIDHEYIDLPIKGDKKGDIFIPLYPYNDTIFGYLYFNWQKDKNFNIADIIFFLKFFFSDDAKFIFLNYDNVEKTIQNIDTLLDDKNQVFVALLSIDDKDRLKERLSNDLKDSLEKMVNEKLNLELFYFEIFDISNFTFGIYSTYSNREDITEKLEQFLKLDNSYELPNYGNVNFKFSCGVAFSETESETDANSLIEKSNEKLKRAIIEGGNKIVF